MCTRTSTLLQKKRDHATLKTLIQIYSCTEYEYIKSEYSERSGFRGDFGNKYIFPSASLSHLSGSFLTLNAAATSAPDIMECPSSRDDQSFLTLTNIKSICDNCGSSMPFHGLPYAKFKAHFSLFQ